MHYSHLSTYCSLDNQTEIKLFLEFFTQSVEQNTIETSGISVRKDQYHNDTMNSDRKMNFHC